MISISIYLRSIHIDPVQYIIRQEKFLGFQAQMVHK
jgi:hypothetical protein